MVPFFEDIEESIEKNKIQCRCWLAIIALLILLSLITAEAWKYRKETNRLKDIPNAERLEKH